MPASSRIPTTVATRAPAGLLEGRVPGGVVADRSPDHVGAVGAPGTASRCSRSRGRRTSWCAPASGRRTARRTRRRPRRPGPRPPAVSLLRVAGATAAAQGRPTGRRSPPVSTRRAVWSMSLSSRGAQQLEVAARLLLVLQGPVEAEQHDRRRVRVDLDGPPVGRRRRVEVEAEQRRRPLPRGCRRRTPACPCWTGARPASYLRKSLLSACSAGRDPVAFVTTSGCVDPGQARARRRTARAPPRSRRPCAPADRCSRRPDSSSTARPVGRFSPQARSIPR